MAQGADWKLLPFPQPNSRWDIDGMDRTVRVMGTVEGYVVCRRSGSMPYLVHMSDWHKTYKPKPLPERKNDAVS